MKFYYYIEKSWPDAQRIIDTLQTKNIIPKAYISGGRVIVVIETNEIKKAREICDGWRITAHEKL